VLHQRPEKRQARDSDGASVATNITGLGHKASAAAMIATASSADGVGDITTPDGGGSSFSDTTARVSDCRSTTEAVFR
jgi:hypothetical protein